LSDRLAINRDACRGDSLNYGAHMSDGHFALAFAPDPQTSGAMQLPTASLPIYPALSFIRSFPSVRKEKS